MTEVTVDDQSILADYKDSVEILINNFKEEYVFMQDMRSFYTPESIYDLVVKK